MFEAPDRCMPLSRPIGRGVEGSRPQRRPRPRPPRPRGVPWEAQLRSTSGLLKNKFSNGCFVITSIFQKQISENIDSEIWSSLFYVFWALWEAHFFNPVEFVEAAAWSKTVNHLETQLAFVFPIFLFPASILGIWGQICAKQAVWMVRIFQGKLKATCDAQKRHQAGTKAGTPNRNLKNLKLKQAWRPEPAESYESYESDDDEDFPRPGLRCHKLFHPQCHLWGETVRPTLRARPWIASMISDTASSN